MPTHKPAPFAVAFGPARTGFNAAASSAALSLSTCSTLLILLRSRTLRGSGECLGRTSGATVRSADRWAV